jgi:hypothetical protein
LTIYFYSLWSVFLASNHGVEMAHLKSVEWAHVAASGRVEEVTSVLATCNRGLKLAMSSEVLQRVLWKYEGVLWAHHLVIPSLVLDRLRALRIWRRVLVVPGCHPLGLQREATAHLCFESVDEWDLSIQALRPCVIRNASVVCISELVFPRNALSQLAAAAGNDDWQTFVDVHEGLDQELHTHDRLFFNFLFLLSQAFEAACEEGLELIIPALFDSHGLPRIQGVPRLEAEQVSFQWFCLLDTCHNAVASMTHDFYDQDHLLKIKNIENEVWAKEWLTHMSQGDSMYASVKVVTGASGGWLDLQ